MTAAVLVAVVTVLPLAVVAADGFGSSPAGALEYLIRPRTVELLTNTLLLLLVTVPATIVLGVGAAWLVERTDLPLAGVWRVLLGAPLAVPAFVAVMVLAMAAIAILGFALVGLGLLLLAGVCAALRWGVAAGVAAAAGAAARTPTSRPARS